MTVDLLSEAIALEEDVVVQQGQVFNLDSKDVDAGVLWAYRYRTGGRGSKRMQRGRFRQRARRARGARASAREAAA